MKTISFIDFQEQFDDSFEMSRDEIEDEVVEFIRKSKENGMYDDNLGVIGSLVCNSLTDKKGFPYISTLSTIDAKVTHYFTKDLSIDHYRLEDFLDYLKLINILASASLNKDESYYHIAVTSSVISMEMGNHRLFNVAKEDENLIEFDTTIVDLINGLYFKLNNNKFISMAFVCSNEFGRSRGFNINYGLHVIVARKYDLKKDKGVSIITNIYMSTDRSISAAKQLGIPIMHQIVSPGDGKTLLHEFMTIEEDMEKDPIIPISMIELAQRVNDGNGDWLPITDAYKICSKKASYSAISALHYLNSTSSRQELFYKDHIFQISGPITTIAESISVFHNMDYTIMRHINDVNEWVLNLYHSDDVDDYRKWDILEIKAKGSRIKVDQTKYKVYESREIIKAGVMIGSYEGEYPYMIYFYMEDKDDAFVSYITALSDVYIVSERYNSTYNKEIEDAIYSCIICANNSQKALELIKD